MAECEYGETDPGGGTVSTHRFGDITGIERIGLVDARGAVLLHEVQTVAFAPTRIEKHGVQRDDDAHFALQLTGRINRSDDQVSAVWMVDLDGAALVVGMVIDAVARGLGEQGVSDLLDRAQRHFGDRAGGADGDG